MFGSQRQMSIWIAVIVTEQQSTYAARGQPRVVQLQPLHADSCSARLQCSTNQWSDCASLPAAKPLGAPGGGLCYHYKYFEPTLQGLSGLLKPEILGIPPDLNPPQIPIFSSCTRCFKIPLLSSTAVNVTPVHLSNNITFLLCIQSLLLSVLCQT